MKKIIIGSLISIIASTGLFAQATYGIEVGTKTSSVQNKNILGIQPLTEIIGDGGTETFVEAKGCGETVTFGLRYSRNNEIDDNKGEFTWSYTPYTSTYINWGFNGAIGGGVISGQEKNISTSITNIRYITSYDLDQYKVPTRAKIGSTTYMTVSIGTKVDFKITDNLRASIGYEYENKYLDIQYDVDNSAHGVAVNGVNAASHGARIGLEYRF